MIYLDQRTQEQIADFVEACARYWDLRGVAQERSHEMRVELEEHIVQAALDGKSLEVVVGSNPAAFAESWAREMHPRIWRAGAVIVPSLVYALGVVSTTAFIQQVLTHASSFTLTLFAVYLLTSSGLLALLVPLGGFLAPRIGTRTRRGLWLLAGGALVALALRETGMRVNWGLALLSWSWPLTLLLLALAAILPCLHVWWAARRKQTIALNGSVSLGRAVLPFVVRVAVFDVVLSVGSLAVFNVCLLSSKLL